MKLDLAITVGVYGNNYLAAQLLEMMITCNSVVLYMLFLCILELVQVLFTVLNRQQDRDATKGHHNYLLGATCV